MRLWWNERFLRMEPGDNQLRQDRKDKEDGERQRELVETMVRVRCNRE